MWLSVRHHDLLRLLVLLVVVHALVLVVAPAGADTAVWLPRHALRGTAPATGDLDRVGRPRPVRPVSADAGLRPAGGYRINW